MRVRERKNMKKPTRIKTIAGDNLRESVKSGGCGNCRASCQSACKTSCTVANQPCESRASTPDSAASGGVDA
jgi:predicted ribosomally synthesized six-cysteine peptide SCIFF